MYEDQTYKAILQRMLNRVPDDIDKRPGSIIYDALAPAALELANVFIALDAGHRAVLPSTATDENLDAATEAFGMTRKQANFAIRKGLFYGASNVPLDVPIGSRFSLAGLNYIVILKLSAGQFELQCETAGKIGNQNFGTILPLDYINGLVTASLTDVLILGEDTETDEEYRERFLQQVRLPSASGNKADYMKWALEVDGVGGVQVKPLWNGPGTVKVIIIDSSKHPASPQLVQNIQNYISPTTGTGEGKAPIGANVTVTAATAVTINVTATVVRNGISSLAQIEADFEEAMSSHLSGIAFGTDPSVKYAKLGALLLDVLGVQDYTSLQLNGTNGNISVSEGSVAVKGSVVLSE
ncbi:baseplate J protein [Paenibacillus sp. LMG 31461]|uniref:Baseplate J protein n=1 Tax=Paenibacillus plantarum TaxID=2654975 RepID=A0ABX1XIP6_9BACL|nr:baseplate J/gp47 family protein [Paenibacillus plantarum]NOU68395.1 baseplate J protein [Paenibacillus plantarum]